MSITKKKWIISPNNSELQLKISRELNISPVLAQLCINRGMTTSEEIDKFIRINPSEIHNPFAFCQMQQAVDLIEETINNKEKILVYGDYDVDGITGTSLLYLYLNSRKASAFYYIPDRIEEGYGLNERAIYQAKQMGYSLIITVDCGINSQCETELANTLGMKVIITDHHTPPEELPQASAIINPKIKGSGYPFEGLAGVGVAWKLAQALEIHYGAKLSRETVVLDQYLDLVTFGTVADIVPLNGENRVIVAMGLKRIATSERPGIKALLSVTGLENKPISSGQVGFILAPRLNAVGRISQASLAVELLTEMNYQACLSRARELDDTNIQRQEIEGEIYRQAVSMIGEMINLEEDFLIVLASQDWHPGVVGIVSSRLVEKFNRPVIMFAIDGETAKGSARSIEQFDIYQAFRQCEDLIIQFGGHKAAAGIKVKTENIEPFRNAINVYANGIINKDIIIPVVKIDMELDANGAEDVYIEDNEKLAPYGSGNAQPVFVYRNLRVIEAKSVGNLQTHLKVVFESGDYILEGIGFHLSQHLSWINTYGRVDVAATLERNKWNGKDKVQLLIRDIQPHLPSSQVLFDSNIFNGKAGKLQLESIIDRREIENREAYLFTLLKKNENCLIYFSSRDRMEEFVQLIAELELPGVKMDCCHGDQRSWQHEIAITKVKNGMINTVAFTGHLSVEIEGLFQHVIFFHCPRDISTFYRLTSWGHSTGFPKIHLLFNQKDMEKLDTDLHVDFPDRELLGKIYKSVKTIASSANRINGSRSEILRKIRVEGLDQVKEEVFDAWLSIMLELGLISLSIQGKRYCLELINSGNKCKLEDSFCYAEGLRVKNAFDLWAKIAFSPHLKEEICALLD